MSAEYRLLLKGKNSIKITIKFAGRKKEETFFKDVRDMDYDTEAIFQKTLFPNKRPVIIGTEVRLRFSSFYSKKGKKRIN